MIKLKVANKVNKQKQTEMESNTVWQQSRYAPTPPRIQDVEKDNLNEEELFNKGEFQPVVSWKIYQI